ncbi:hypothetical protein D3C73_1349320 [compost metagenome]
MAVQPLMAKVITLLMRQRFFGIDNGRYRCRKQAKHKGRADVFAPADFYPMVIDLGQVLVDILGVPAQLGEDKRRLQIQLHHPRQREDHILRAQRVAAGKFGVRSQGKSQAAVIAARLPFAGQRRFKLNRIFWIGLDQPLIQAVK